MACGASALSPIGVLRPSGDASRASQNPEGTMKLLFGGLIAVILLGLYVYSVVFAVMIVSQSAVGSFTEGFATTMTTVGGLVSALVIAELAVTKPGEAPVARALRSGDGPALGQKATRVLTGLTGSYLLVWVIVGLAAYVVGTMWYPGKLQHLTDLGQAWLGLAVAAAYAYFGINAK
jgi:hypothetical protein